MIAAALFQFAKLATYALIAILSYYVVRAAYYLTRRQQIASKLHFIPGPKPDLIYGNSKLFRDENGEPSTRVFWNTLYAQAKKYGRIFRLAFGPFNIVYLYQPEYVEKVLSSSRLIEKGECGSYC